MIPIASPEISSDEIQSVEEILKSGMLADGPEVRQFESEFAAYCRVDHGVATSNGTTALHAALEALGIGEGDTVLTTPFSFVASANAIRFAGAQPVFADIDPQTFNLDPAAVEQTIERRSIDAILAVHLYGLPANMERLNAIATAHDIPVVEDAAQAHGAACQGKRVGSLGDVACFSFYPTKNMTTGEGGMIVTDDETVAERAARFVNHGRTGSYTHASLGHNFRMTSIAAALGRKQLEKLDEFIERRQRNADLLDDLLAETSVQAPHVPEGRTHVYHQYTIRHEQRDRLASHLEENEIGSAVYYPKCIHQQPAYENIKEEFQSAECAAQEVLSLPIHPNVSEREIRRIGEEIQRYVSTK